MNIHLISTILKSVWAIDPDAALSYAPLLSNLIGTGMKLEFSFDGQEFKPSVIDDLPDDDDIDDEKLEVYRVRKVAVVPIKGPLMKEDQYCGPEGMASIGAYIKRLDAREDIDAILLHIDSPGGTVDGTMDLAEIVANTSKPVVAFADGLMASAAMWIGSAANEIIASNNKTEIGSIGVMLSFADLQPAYEKLGVKFHTIVADQSADKNKMYQMIREGKYEDYKKEVLNPLAADFIAAIKKNRPNVKDDQLTGKLFFAENLVGTLIDSIGNFDYAVQRAAMLADQHKKAQSKQSKTPVSMKNFENVNKVLEVDQLEAQDEGVFLNEDQVAALDAALAQGAQDATDLQAAVAARTKAEGDLAAAEQSIQEKDAEIAQLKKGAGAEPAVVITQSDPATAGEKSENLTDSRKSFEENLKAVEELL